MMNTWKLWERGIWLSRAPVICASKAKRERHRQLQEVGGFLPMLQRWAERVQAKTPLAEAVAPVPEADELRQLTNEMQRDIVRWVQDGKLKAYGFGVPRRPEDAPQPVPLDLWSGTIGWGRSILAANGLRMEGVRLLLLESDKHLRGGRSPGRPSREAQILEAFDTLQASGQVDRTRPMAHLFEPIRQLVRDKHPTNKTDQGLNDKTIARVIRERFVERDKTQNS